MTDALVPNELNAKIELDVFVRRRLEELKIFSEEFCQHIQKYDTVRQDGFRHTTTLTVAGNTFTANQIRKIDAEIDAAQSALNSIRENELKFDEDILHLHQERNQVILSDFRRCFRS